MLGACSGGVTAAVLLGHYAALGDNRIKALTLMVSVLDTDFDSQYALFVDDKTLDAAKRRSSEAGVLEGRDLARVFAWMRPNDLIWNYWVNNYLLGNLPPEFDILYWNNDTTRLPAGLHHDMIELFRNNPLRTPGALEVCGTPIDLKSIEAEVFCIAGTTDTSRPGRPATGPPGCSANTANSCSPTAVISRAFSIRPAIPRRASCTAQPWRRTRMPGSRRH